jgi:Spy/CpxP family protein refolding chaperone
MKQIIAVTILGAALTAGAVAAQPAGERGREGRKGQRGQAAAAYLGLSPEQEAQWAALREQNRDAMRLVHQEGQELRKRLQEALEADAPDVEVGVAAKAVYAHRQEAQKAREAFEDQLVSILNEDQKVKYEAFKAARKADGKGRRGRGRRGEAGGEGRGWAGPPIEG